MARRSKISAGVRQRVYLRDDWTCQYCGLRIDPETEGQRNGRNAPFVMRGPDYIWLELDHIHPLRLGGANTEGNLQSACTPCNKVKAISTQQVDWAARIEIALGILAGGEPDKRTAERAAEALTGDRVRLRSTRSNRGA